MEQEFPDEQAVKTAVVHERSRAKEWIDEHPSESREESPRQLTVAESEAGNVSSRSVFDDVDE